MGQYPDLVVLIPTFVTGDGHDDAGRYRVMNEGEGEGEG
jgi:hypothetical protein